MNELKCCPFCGGKTTLDEYEFYMFCCDTCGAGITFAKELDDGTACDCTKKESIDKWNTRKPMERIKEQLKEITYRIDDSAILSTRDVINEEDAIEIVEKGGMEYEE